MASVAGEVALRCEGIAARVGDRTLLAPLSLSLRAGELTGLVGPNGAGKSTALKLLAGELEGEGRVWRGDCDLTRCTLSERARQGVGYLPQGAASLPGLTSREQLMVISELRGMRGSLQRERVSAWLDRLELGHRAGVRVESLSGGERRRLEVAGVLLGGFAVLLLDEPFAAVEPRGVERMVAALREACASGAAVLLADHARETLGACDEAMLLVQGEVRLRARAAELRQHPVLREVYLGIGGSNEIADAKSAPKV